MSHKPAAKKTRRGGESRTKIGDIKDLIGGLKSFVETYTSVGSTRLVESVCKEIAAQTSMQTAAMVPINRNILSFGDALAWGFFLNHETSVLASHGVAKFNLGKFYAHVAEVYDQEVEEAVLDHYDEDSSSESESSSDSDSDAAPGGGGPAPPDAETSEPAGAE